MHTRLSTAIFVLISVLVIYTTLAYGAVHQPVLVLSYLIVLLIAVLWGADMVLGGRLRYSRSLLQLPLLLLAVYGLVQTIPFGYVSVVGVGQIPRTISLEPNATQLTAIHMLLLCIFLAACLAYLDTAVRLRRLARILTIFGFLYAFYAILQSVLSPDNIYGLYDPASAVPFGSFVNRHNFAAIIEMLISIPLGLLFVGAVERDKRLLYVVAAVLMGSALLLSGSRGGLVALGLQLVFLVLISSRASAHRRTGLKIALSLLLVLGVIGGAMFTGGDTSLTRFAESAARQNISSDRFEIWSITLKMIGDYLPFGTGLGAYATAFTKFDTAVGVARVEQAHNDYLQIVSDAGVIGFVLGGLFLFLLFREGLRHTVIRNTFRRGIAVGAFTACFGVLVHSMFDFVLHVTAISAMFLVMMALLVASGRHFDDDVAEFDERHSRRRRRRKASVTQIHESSPAA